MPQATKGKEKQEKAKGAKGTKVILMPADDGAEEKNESADEDEGGMYLEKEDVQIIFNALREYKPTEKEEQLYELLLESFEEILVCDYGEPMPDVN
jgi:hypothetical protein